MSAFIVHPLEKHVFVDDPDDDYRCKACQRPRALHAVKAEQTKLSNLDPSTQPIRTARFTVAHAGKLLTDKKIAEYQEKGVYASRALYLQSKRGEGNWKWVNGRPIYSP